MPVVHEPNEDGSSGAFVARDEGPVHFGVSYEAVRSATGAVVWTLKMDRPLHASWVDRIVDAIAEHATLNALRVIGIGPFKSSLAARHPEVLVSADHPVLAARFPTPKPNAAQPEPISKKVEVEPTPALVRYARIFKREPGNSVTIGSTHFRGIGNSVWVRWPTDRVQCLGFTPSERIEAQLDRAQLERIRQREVFPFEATQVETPCNTVAYYRDFGKFRVSEPKSIDDLFAQYAELGLETEGAHSILDMTTVGPEPDFGILAPLDDDQIDALFETLTPTRAQIEAERSLIEAIRQRWEGTYLIAYEDGLPSEICFIGFSGD
jgi:antitoxin component of MazEF toxin-antitoxin module